MNDKFRAIVLSQSGEKFSREIKTLDKSFLKHGDVLVKVDYSGLNYKDALILNDGGKLVKEFPHIPGIDFSGTVVESENNNFKSGDKVILHGWRVGEIFYGGYSQYAKVNADFLIGDNNFTTFVELKLPATPLFGNSKNRSNAWSLSNSLIDG